MLYALFYEIEVHPIKVIWIFHQEENGIVKWILYQTEKYNITFLFNVNTNSVFLYRRTTLFAIATEWCSAIVHMLSQYNQRLVYKHNIFEIFIKCYLNRKLFERWKKMGEGKKQPFEVLYKQHKFQTNEWTNGERKAQTEKKLCHANYLSRFPLPCHLQCERNKTERKCLFTNMRFTTWGWYLKAWFTATMGTLNELELTRYAHTCFVVSGLEQCTERNICKNESCECLKRNKTWPATWTFPHIEYVFFGIFIFVW